MASIPDRLRLKDRIVSNVAKAIKSIQECRVYQGCGEESVALGNNYRPCQKLTEHLDHVFLHGLKHINNGYWKVVTEFTRKDAVKEIKRLKHVTTDLGRGRAWLMMALNECVLESYIRCYLDNKKMVKRHYVKEAFVLDDQRMTVLLTLTSGLEYAVFQLDYDVPYLDLSTYPPGCRSRSSSDNSANQGDDRVSLCSMDSIVSFRHRNSTFMLPQDAVQSQEGDGSSVNSADAVSANHSTVYKTENTSIDSGIQLCEKDNGNSEHRTNFRRGHDRDITVQDEALEVIRVTSGIKTKRKKSKKSGKQSSLKKAISLPEKDSPVQIKQTNLLSWSPKEPDGLANFNFDTSPLDLPDRSPGDGMESKSSSDASIDTNVFLRGAEHDRAKVMENYNIAFVEDGDFTIHKDSKPPPHSLSDYVLGAGSENISRKQDLTDIKSSNLSNSTTHDSLNFSSSRSSRVLEETTLDSLIFSNSRNSRVLDEANGNIETPEKTGDVQYSYVSEKLLSTVGPYFDSARSVDTNEEVKANSCDEEIYTVDNIATSVTDNSSAGHTQGLDVPSKPETNLSDSIYSATTGNEEDLSVTNQKSATSEMQERVNNMINQSDAVLHKHMFVEEPDDVDIEDVLDGEESVCEGEIRLDNNTKLYLMLDVFEDSHEQFIRAFGTRTGHNEGDAKPVIMLITDRALHLLSQTKSDHRFVKDISIPYVQLDYVSLSVADQFIQIVCTNRRKQYWITTGSQLVTKAIISCLTSTIKQSEYDIPQLSVLTDATTQKIALRKYAAKECSCDVSDVNICCYSLVHWDDPNVRGTNSEATNREGHMLYKITETATSLGSTLLNTVQDPTSILYGASWKSAYIVLRDGLLCLFASKNDSKPLQFVQLGGDDCVGCRRSSDMDRDHCIKIIKSNGTTWQLAFATESEANDWLQSLCQAVAHGLEKSSHSANCLPCCLVLTPQKLLMCHEDVQISFLRTLGSANILDITGVLMDTSVKTYCVLEFESHDNGASNDQWVLYFNDQSETERFHQSLSAAWATHFQVEVPVSPVDDFTLQKRCRDIAAQLKNSLQVKT